jgi:hypothetical protein
MRVVHGLERDARVGAVKVGICHEFLDGIEDFFED